MLLRGGSGLPLRWRAPSARLEIVGQGRSRPLAALMGPDEGRDARAQPGRQPGVERGADLVRAVAGREVRQQDRLVLEQLGALGDLVEVHVALGPRLVHADALVDEGALEQENARAARHLLLL